MLKDVEKTVNRLVEHYEENEKKALMFKTNNTFEYQVNWKELLAEGRDQRHIIDVELYRNTSRIDRYNKTKQELKEKLDSVQEKKEHGKEGTSRIGDLQQKLSHRGQKPSERVREKKSRIG
jgi:Tfp pilus assembly pilus retraction ATPase PilT